MRPRRHTLLHGSGCTCDDCHASRLLFAISLIMVAAAGLAWLFLGAQ